jgi:hypothetical protein
MSGVNQYEYERSIQPQSLYKDDCCTDYQFNYINDINSTIYQNSSLSLVQYDLTSIYNSSKMTNTADHYIVIPAVRTVRLTNGNSQAVVPMNVANAFSCLSFKNGTQSIIHMADLAVDGKTICQLQPYQNVVSGINIVSKMSKDDLTMNGKIKGLASSGLDNPNSTIFSGSYTLDGTTYDLSGAGIFGGARAQPSGPGLSNNLPFGPSIYNSSGNAENVGTSFQSQAGPQNFLTVNNCIQEKLAWTVNASGQMNQIFGSNSAGTANYIMPINRLNQDFTSYSQYIASTGTYVYYDYLIIKLSDIIGSMDNIGLLRRYNAVLRIYINTGLITVSANTINTNYEQLIFRGNSYTTFTNTCPILINNLSSSQNWSSNPFTDITAGFFIGKSPDYSIQTYSGASVNFLGYSSAITSTRYYYSSILLDPLKASDYLTSQQTKTVISNEYLYNTYSNIQAGSNYSQLIQSGVRNIKTVIIIPYIASSLFNFSQLGSPFDCAGGAGCTSPLSLINLQVAIGGINQLTNTLTYQYENWIEQLSKFNKESSALGVESSLLDYNFWNYNKIYLVNVNSQIDDNETPRNVVVSFVNNSNLPMDVQVFVVYEQEIIVNCSTGAVVVK